MRRIICSPALMDCFCSEVEENTVKGNESIGVFFGKPVSEMPEHANCSQWHEHGEDEWEVTDVFIPSQSGRSDSCEIDSLYGCSELQEYAEDNGVTQLGWIHTHPQWEVFMSSVDLHNQWLLQKDNSQLVAIVVNPTQQQPGLNDAFYGVYQLSPEGMDKISKCQSTGFHVHDDREALYQAPFHFHVGFRNTSSKMRYTTSERLAWYKPKSRGRTWNWIARSYGLAIPVDSNSQEDPPENESLETSRNAVPVEVGTSSSRDLQDRQVQTGLTATPMPSFFHDYIPVPQSGTHKASDSEIHASDLIHLCQDFINAEGECASKLVEQKDVMKAICQLENSIIDICSSGLADGALYATSFKINDRYVYTRFLEHGVVHGTFSALRSRVHDLLGPGNIEWRVLTSEDMEHRTSSYQSNLSDKRKEKQVSSKSLPDSGRRWKSSVKSGKKSVHNVHSKLLATARNNSSDCKLLGTCVHIFKKEKVHRIVNNAAQDIHLQSGIFEPDSDGFLLCLENFRIHGERKPEKSFVELTDTKEVQSAQLSVEQQSEVINSLPNDPCTSGRSQIRFDCYFSCGSTDCLPSGKPRYLPTSARNLILFHSRNADKNSVGRELSKIIGPQPDTGPPEKRRKTTRNDCSRTTISSAVTDPDTSPPLEIPEYRTIVESPPALVLSAYQTFVRNLVENGVIQWRVHSPSLDIVSMNDIDLDLGTFQVRKFTHVSRRKDIGLDTPSFSCECLMSTMLLRMDGMPNNECVHVRFFNDYLEPLYENAFTPGSSTPQSPLGNKLKGALKSLNSGVVRLDRHPRYHCFSVMAQDRLGCALVTLDGGKFRCHNGECRAKAGHTRKTNRLDDAKSPLCQHLNVIRCQREVWEDLVADMHGNGCDEGDVDARHDDDEETVSPLPCDQETKGNANSMIYFDQASGLWKARSQSQHVPRLLSDPILIDAIQERLSINFKNPEYCVNDSGFIMRNSAEGLQPLLLYPKLDKDILCKCGLNYWDEERPEGVVTPQQKDLLNVYLLHGVAKFMVNKRECLNSNEECQMLYDGRQDGLHILSRVTAAGDELGWEFVNMVMNSQSSISCFCSVRNASYFGSTVPFMSRQTFTDWIFTWMANFQEDFRQVCQYCGENPQILACDGTKLGFFFRHVNITSIEDPDNDICHSAVHRRCDRQFFKYSVDDSSLHKDACKLARRCLEYYVAKNSNTLKEFTKTSSHKHVSDLSEDEKKDKILSCIPSHLYDVFCKFIDVSFDQNLIAKLCPIFKVFCSEVPLSSLVNFRLLDTLSIAIRENSLSMIREELPELHSLLQAAQLCGEVEHIHRLIKYVTSEISRVHEGDRNPDDTGVVKLYNPEKHGRAYYFTKHANQLREMPKYVLKDGGKSDSVSCKKIFPECAKSGTTYLFLMFDPAHYGHCYGFHIITGSEGRKDAFSPPFLYMESAPKEVFYDFSCQLEEYCLNREPKFWRETRFWHDIFHGYSHKCPFVYSSRRIQSLHQNNTEICEQFNSYIQKIKFSARSMSQRHFIFYLQFFIHQWNLKKKLEYEKQIINVQDLVK